MTSNDVIGYIVLFIMLYSGVLSLVVALWALIVCVKETIKDYRN